MCVNICADGTQQDRKDSNALLHPTTEALTVSVTRHKMGTSVNFRNSGALWHHTMMKLNESACDRSHVNPRDSSVL